MPTAYLSFCRPLNADTATSLMVACKSLVSELDPNTHAPRWDTIDISIACGGGDVVSSFGIYNELKGLPITYITRNSGAVDSAAIMPFLLGSKRYAAASSAFFFHQTAWTFASNAQLPISIVGDAAEWLSHYQRMMAELVASKSSIKADEVSRLMHDGSIMSATDAKAASLIDDVAELVVPQGARWHQV